MTTRTLLNLTEFLPFRLSVLSNTISERISAAYRRDFGLSVPQWRVMAVIGQNPGLTATQLAETTRMDKVAVSRAIAGLIDDGRLERRATLHDGRSSTLYLTRRGEEIYDEVAPLARQFEDELLSQLSASDQKALKRLLDLMAKAASPDQPLW